MTERMVTNFCRECMERQAELDRANKRLIEVLEEKIEADKLVKRLRKVMLVEASKHDDASPVLLQDGRTMCLCPFCLVAREAQ